MVFTTWGDKSHVLIFFSKLLRIFVYLCFLLFFVILFRTLFLCLFLLPIFPLPIFPLLVPLSLILIPLPPIILPILLHFKSELVSHCASWLQGTGREASEAIAALGDGSKTISKHQALTACPVALFVG